MSEVRFRNPFALHPLIIGLLACATAAAQAENVRISGLVRDPSGAEAQNVCVTLQAAGATKIVSAIRTNDKGEFAFERVLANTYDLSFKATGFIRRSLTVKADGNAVAVPPIVLQISLYTPYVDVPGLEEMRELQAKIHREGTLEVRESCGLDLDAGKAICVASNVGAPPAPSKLDDVRIERDNDRLYFVPANGATIGKGFNGASVLYNCSSARYATDRIRIDDLAEGSPVCMKTNEGRRVELWLWFKEPVCAEGDVWIQFVTWNR